MLLAFLRQQPILSFLAGAVLLGAAALLLIGEATGSEYQQAVDAFLAMSPLSIMLAVLFTIASFAALSLADYSAFKAIGTPRSWTDIAPGSLAAYAISQSIGLGPLSGAAVRMRYYIPLGVPPGDVAKIVGFSMLAFWLGILLVAATGALADRSQLAIIAGSGARWGGAAAVGALAVVAAVFFASGRTIALPVLKRDVTLPAASTLARQVLLTIVDVACAAGVLWVLLPDGTIGYPAFVALYAIAVVIGAASHVPGGLGVFEAVIVLALKNAAPVSALVSALAVYRLIYTAMPLAVTAVGIALVEGRAAINHPAGRTITSAMRVLAPQTLSAMAVVLGAMLIFSGVTPAKADDLEWLGEYLPLFVIEASHFFASTLGFALLVSARGLAFRLSGAWLVAFVASLLGVVLSLLKALALYEALALTLFCIMLILTRKGFRRPSALLNLAFTPRWIAGVAAVVVSAGVLIWFANDHAALSFGSWLHFELGGEASRSTRALLGVAIVFGIFGLWSLIRPPVAPFHRPPQESIDKAVRIVLAQGMSDANLVRMGDKDILFSEDGRAFIMYSRIGKSWIALFDPIGPRDALPDLIWSFVEKARLSGGRAAFYQVTPENLTLYADAGLTFYKLGEEARVDLHTFKLEGADRKDLRYALSRGRRERLEMQVVNIADVPALINALDEVSTEWLTLRGGREKGFSLGSFVPQYIAQQRVAILRQDQQIVAFATLLETNCNEEVSIDLMRHRKQVPAVAMETLFVSLIEYFQQRGTRWFVLGMAPLSGLSRRQVAPAWQQIGRSIFEHGSVSYNFKGLRSFKERFRPVWRPRYLAVAGGASPALALIDATRLINTPPMDDDT